jgi:hypothetical protein
MKAKFPITVGEKIIFEDAFLGIQGGTIKEFDSLGFQLKEKMNCYLWHNLIRWMPETSVKDWIIPGDN